MHAPVGFGSRFAKHKRRKRGAPKLPKLPKLAGLRARLAKLQAAGAFRKPSAKAPGPRTYGAGVD